MNADAFRHLYGYHFSQNREVWDRFVAPLIDEQYTQGSAYSHGSVRDQLIHLMEVDELWFRGLQGEDEIDLPDPASYTDRAALREHWDEVETLMRAYLDALTDEQLTGKPFTYEEDEDLFAWQVLLHVVNHGTDHRAQVLRLLNDLGVTTESQDYIFYVYENP